MTFLKKIPSIAIAIAWGAYSYGFSLTYFLRDSGKVPYIGHSFSIVKWRRSTHVCHFLFIISSMAFRLRYLASDPRLRGSTANHWKHKMSKAGVRGDSDLPLRASTA
jgi:hypothetical protein